MIQCNPVNKYMNSHLKTALVLVTIISTGEVFQKLTSLWLCKTISNFQPTFIHSKLKNLALGTTAFFYILK